jgi:hypothetical protein
MGEGDVEESVMAIIGGKNWEQIYHIYQMEASCKKKNNCIHNIKVHIASI